MNTYSLFLVPLLVGVFTPPEKTLAHEMLRKQSKKSVERTQGATESFSHTPSAQSIKLNIYKKTVYFLLWENH